jgi:hypothetical protein
VSALLRFTSKLSATPPTTSAVPPHRTKHAYMPRTQPRAGAIRALVVTLICVVHGLGGLQPLAAEPRLKGDRTAQTSSAPTLKRSPIADLPIPVQEMRDAILIAVASGDIEELRLPIEWNELRPEFGIPRDKDPIKYWRKSSKDGSGREILAILGNLLADAPARLPIGPDLENNDVFVWPYLSELPPNKLSPSQEVELFRIVPPEEAAKMRTGKKWTWYRLAIAADGTWHIFSKPSSEP